MLRDDIPLISVDDHVIEHENVWQDRLPAAMKAAGPKIERDDQGRELWVYEGVANPTIGLNAVAGKKREDFGMEPTNFADMIPGCYDVAERVKDMDVDGVQRQLCFPSFPGFAGRTFFNSKDKDLGLACVQAWNDFMTDEWCGYAPDRFIPLIIVPMWDPALCAQEIYRMAAKGAKAITFTENPVESGLPSYHSDHWDPMLAAAEETGMPLCLHFGSGGAPTFSPDAPFAVAISLFGLNSMTVTAELLFSQVFVKFPQLKVALSEGGIGWMPYMLERIDATWERHRFYQGLDTHQRPSELFADHIFGCFITDEAGLEQRHRIGIEQLTWECDYPHSDSNWPNSRKVMTEAFRNIPDDEVALIASGNATRIYNL